MCLVGENEKEGGGSMQKNGTKDVTEGEGGEAKGILKIQKFF